MYFLRLLCFLTPVFTMAEVYDSVVVSADNQAIKASQVEQDLRVTAFLNGAPLEKSLAQKRKAADRLVDQLLIRNEMERMHAATALPPVTVWENIKRGRFQSEAEVREALGKYELTEAQVRQQISWQLAVIAFVDVRFRPAKLQGVSAKPGQEEENANRAFFAWLETAHKQAHARYRGELAQ